MRIDLHTHSTMSDGTDEPAALVRTSDQARLGEALTAAGIGVTSQDGGLRVATGDLARIGDLALQVGVPVHELRPLRTDLERLFLELTEAPEHRNRNRSEEVAR